MKTKVHVTCFIQAADIKDKSLINYKPDFANQALTAKCQHK